MRDRIKALFLGTAIGDALGMSVETFTPEKILEKYPETNGTITDYIVPTGHKWFDGRPAGTWTDDTQLTLAVAKGLIKAKGFDMDAQADAHIFSYKTDGHAAWGGTTREAIRSLANGVHWSKSGLKNEGRGKGNGLPMKISPVSAVLYQLIKGNNPEPVERDKIALEAFQFVKNLNFMTHYTEMSLCAAFAQVMAAFYCLAADPFDSDAFAATIKRAGLRGKQWCAEGRLNTDPETDDITQRFALLEAYREYNIPRIVEEFMGEGGQRFCCYWNMPLTYMMFLRNPHGIETLYDTVSVGGDADTNGAIVGAMLGAVNGMSVFPQHLIDGLDRKEEILDIAEEFCDVFGIQND